MDRNLFVFFLFFSFCCGQRNFVIDYENDRFLKDGKPFQYISGSIHYSRVPSFYWKDRLIKIQAAGLNAIQFYIPWNIHEPFEGKFDFSGDANVTHFMDLAASLNLPIILRIGPYICGEWENGGLPWWLLKIPDIKMRTADSRFMKAVANWYAVLLPLLQPYLYINGGPVILVQIENEYGSFSACDVKYTTSLRDLVRKYTGYETQLITVDGGSLGYLKCGFIPDVYPTVDFGPGDPRPGFMAQRAYAPRGPLVNSEFYPGWLDLWGKNFSKVPTGPILTSMTEMYKMNASFNFYMFFGGTNFGYWNGASPNLPDTTSYDYDAPISEYGSLTPKYMAIRSEIEKLTKKTAPTPPPSNPIMNYGSVPMQLLGSVILFLKSLIYPRKPVTSMWPLTFEELDHPYGYILYETILPSGSGSNLTGSGVKDRGYVMVDGKIQGILIHSFGTEKRHQISIQARSGQKLQILVENRGRQNYETVNDCKGITSNVTLDGSILQNWTMYPIDLLQIFKTVKKQSTYMKLLKRKARKWARQSNIFSPSIYYSKFPVHKMEDTFFDPTNWTKGQFLLNQHNVGRYWPDVGPQVTLYTPKPYLRPLNYVILLELESPGNCIRPDNISCYVNFTNRPYLNKPVNKNIINGLKLDRREKTPDFVLKL